jgi:hypothetical protein
MMSMFMEWFEKKGVNDILVLDTIQVKVSLVGVPITSRIVYICIFH